MKLFGLAAVFIMCTLIAASSGQAEESFSELDFIYDPFFPSLGGTAVMEDAHQKLIARFGTPTKQEKWSNVPRDPTARVLQEKWLYGGLTFYLEGVADIRPDGSDSPVPGRWITQIVLSNPEISIKQGLGIGTPLKVFQSYFPKMKALNPRQENSSWWVGGFYVATEPDLKYRRQIHVEMEIDFDRDQRATKITWSYNGEQH